MIAKPVAMPGTWGARNARPPAASVNSNSGHRRLRRVAPGWCSGRVALAFALASRRAIGGLVSARRPRRRPMTAAISHQPTAITTRLFSEFPAAASTVTVASAVAAAALSRTVVLRKSTNRTRLLQKRSEQFAHAGRAVDREVGLEPQLGRRFIGAHSHAQRARQAPGAYEGAQPTEGVQIGRVVTHVQRGRDGAPRNSLAIPRPLSSATG